MRTFKKLKELTRFFDHSLWISDDRLSALISHQCQGIQQIDFHGAQPVSRNSKILEHADGVLKFALKVHTNDSEQIIPLTWETLLTYPAGIESTHQWNDLKIQLGVTVFRDALYITCQCRSASEKRNRNRNRLSLHIFWHQASLSTEVHGQRLWSEPEFISSGQVLIRATDQIQLQQWLRRGTDFEGDYLIPEAWRRIIFNRQCVSGTARFEDIRQGYLETPMKLYDADTWLRLGSDGFVIQDHSAAWLRFDSVPAEIKGDRWIAPPFSISFSTQKALLLKSAHQRKKKSQNVINAQKARYKSLAKNAPQIEIVGFPAISEFFGLVPQVVESAKVQDFGMTRACPGTYYWIWAWDNMVTAQAMARWGDTAFLRRMVDFLRTHRDIDGSIPARWSRQLEPMDSRGIGAMDFLFSELVLTLYTETQDRMILRANYGVLHHAFVHLKQRSDANGFYPTIGMYPDLPQKMGRDETSYVAIDAGAWYCFCRNMEKIAWMLDDQTTAVQAAEQAVVIHKNFLPTLWDDETGFLMDAYNPRTQTHVRSYPLFSFLFMESAFGSALLRNQTRRCAEFIKTNLLTEDGVSLTSGWDINHTSETAMSAWYTHWDYAASKLLSRDETGEAALNKWLTLVEKCYQRFGYCPEFVALNVSPEQRWQQHGAPWNLNCAAGWYNALIQAVAGAAFDLGGITCISTFALPCFSLKNLRYRGGSWSIEKCGQGKFISHLVVDDQKIEGSLKIPETFYTTGAHELTVHHSDSLPDFAQLTELNGAALCDVRIDGSDTICSIRGNGLTDVIFSGEREPRMLVDGHLKVVAWDSKRQIGSCQLALSGEHELILANSKSVSGL
ncbi:hypothetical protein JXJ21_04735 [candidate division KSB1 bacterium]|nr:hypothetical protein [candidate division KSB1 bacterium]